MQPGVKIRWTKMMHTVPVLLAVVVMVDLPRMATSFHLPLNLAGIASGGLSSGLCRKRIIRNERVVACKESLYHSQENRNNSASTLNSKKGGGVIPGWWKGGSRRSETGELLSRLKPGAHEHDQDIYGIAGPAIFTLLVDPFLSIIDTAYVGRLGATSLASLGPCTSIFHLSFNGFRALGQSTTALVSQSLALGNKERVRNVVFQAMALAAVLGTGVGIFLRTEGVWALAAMGAPAKSVLSKTGLPYLHARALAAPAVLLLMVCEGTYRGYGDTFTPLPVTFAIAVVNLILDPLLIFGKRAGGILGWGVRGAAVATVIAQYIGLVSYLWLLLVNKRSPLVKAAKEVKASRRSSSTRGTWTSAEPQGFQGGLIHKIKEALPTLAQLLSANVAMLVRNGTLMTTWALATAVATRMGTLDVAAHQVALSIWLFCALISEAPGIAAQVLAARYYAMGKPAQLRSLTKRLAEMGVGIGAALGGLMVLSRGWLPRLFGSDVVVAEKVSHLLVIVGLQLPLVALTLIGEGFLVGCGFFNYLAWTSTLASAACAGVLLSLRRLFPGTANVSHVWWTIKGLFVIRLSMVCLLLFDPKRGPLAATHYHDQFIHHEVPEEQRLPPVDLLVEG